MKKKSLLSLLVATTICFSATACNADNKSTTDDDKHTIGIIQYGSHPSLDNCYKGIEEQLMASSMKDKIEIDRQDGNFDSATCDTIAKNMTAKKYDMIFAIATPAAISAYSAAQNSDIPVIFCAVSDPVEAGLVTSMDSGSKNCTGTSDVLDLDAHIELIRAMQPDAKKIGVLYTTSEANSVSQLATLEEISSDYGFEIVEQGVQNASDIPQAAATLVGKVDCINNFTDNNVVNNLSVLLEKANAAGVPVYGSEIEQVKNGCLASVSIDYVALGKKTAELGLEVLGGKSSVDIPVGKISDGIPVINTDVATSFNIEIPESYKDAELVTTNKQ